MGAPAMSGCCEGVNERMEALGEEWGQVYTFYYPEFDDGQFIVRNKTDEGLPVSAELCEVRGDSFVSTLNEAYERYCSTDSAQRGDSA